MDFYFRQAADAEDLAAAHVLQKIAHHQVGRGLHIRRCNSHDFGAIIDERARVRLNRKTNYVKMRIALRVSFARRFKDQLLADRAVLWPKDRAVLWPKDKGDRFVIAIFN